MGISLTALKPLLADSLQEWRWFPNFKQRADGFLAKFNPESEELDIKVCSSNSDLQAAKSGELQLVVGRYNSLLIAKGSGGLNAGDFEIQNWPGCPNTVRCPFVASVLKWADGTTWVTGTSKSS